MGEMRVPADALYGAQTQRAVENFPISSLRFPPEFVRALALIKACAARVNRDSGELPRDIANAVFAAAEPVAQGGHAESFPVDIFQTGSGTSLNMNAE